MSDALRILFVEDVPEDVVLEEHALRKGGLEFESLRVDTREAFLAAIDGFKPDLILSDYTLPRLDGMAALKIAADTCPEIPFIFVSGTLGEERAIESLKSGAMDYVLKGRLEGLVFKVRRALREAADRLRHRRLEEQLRQAQKMEAIGRLAGGVAHDFNNLMTAVLGYAGVVLQNLPADSSQRKNLEEIQKAGHRAAALTRQLLAFSRKQILEPRVMNLNLAVTDLAAMLRRVIGEQIKCVCRLEPGLGNVKADPGQIEQVILNLALNGRDAMPDGGTLTLETGNVDFDEMRARQTGGVKPGSYVMLAVGDTGIGMTREVQSHIFEPFFTTKGEGKGTGLGLSTVYGIVKQSGGFIWVYSEPDRGSLFKVYLPRIDEPLPRSEPPGSVTEDHRGTETILLAEDSEPVRRLVAGQLAAMGYTVLQAADGEEGVRVAREYPGTIHLLLTDVVMPGKGGRELARELAAARPGIRVLYMSGYADPSAGEDGSFEPGAFMQKPFTRADLLARIRQSLSARAPS